jgi:hypothetical protein
MNDNTRIRIAVPAHLYEAVKKKLTLKEGAYKDATYSQPVKEKKTPSESKPKVEGMKTPKAPKVEGEKQEKTVEERLAALEEAMKSMMKGKKMQDEGMEDEIGYEKGNQKPDGEDDVNLVDDDKKDK